MNQAHHVKMLDELLELESGLSEWEVEFVESLNRTRDTSHWSDRQCEILENTHGREDKRGNLH